MTIREANQIRKAASMPIYCSACLNQQPDLIHVDFDAACDRGYGDDPATKVTFDDLVICENCIKEAAQVLGFKDARELERENGRLRSKVERLEYDVKKAERYAEVLEDAVIKHRGIEIDHRRKPRPPRAAEVPD